MLYDGYRFIWLYRPQISAYAMNIYIAALVLMPQNTLLYKTYQNKFIATPEVFYPKPLTWSPMLSKGTVPHEDILQSVAYTPDGQYFATGSQKGRIDLWDALSGTHLRSFENVFPAWVFKICFLADSQYLISMGHHYNKVYLWNVITGTNILTFEGHSLKINDISVISEQLATASDDRTVKIWNIKTAKCQSTLEHAYLVNSVWLDPKGDRLLSAVSNEVLIWNPSTRELVKTISKSGLKYLIVSPCGNFLAYGFHDILEIYKSQEMETCIKRSQTRYPHSIMFSNCGNYIAFSQHQTIIVSKFQSSNESEIRLNTHMSQVTFSPDSKQLVSGKFTLFSIYFKLD